MISQSKLLFCAVFLPASPLTLLDKLEFNFIAIFFRKKNKTKNKKTLT